MADWSRETTMIVCFYIATGVVSVTAATVGFFFAVLACVKAAQAWGML